MASVSQLGYLGIGISDVKAWQDLAASILGLQVVPGDDPTTSYLRMDECHHRLELRANGADDPRSRRHADVRDQQRLFQILERLLAGRRRRGSGWSRRGASARRRSTSPRISSGARGSRT